MSGERISCRATKGRKKCYHYSYGLGRCAMGTMPIFCTLLKDTPKRKKARETARDFLGMAR
jgi:hypothetical protein